jgi:hypothetical protein
MKTTLTQQCSPSSAASTVLTELIQELEKNYLSNQLQSTSVIDQIKTRIKTSAEPSRSIAQMLRFLAQPVIARLDDLSLRTYPLLFTLKPVTQRQLLMALYGLNALKQDYIQNLLKMDSLDAVDSTVINLLKSFCDEYNISSSDDILSLKNELEKEASSIDGYIFLRKKPTILTNPEQLTASEDKVQKRKGLSTEENIAKKKKTDEEGVSSVTKSINEQKIEQQIKPILPQDVIPKLNKLRAMLDNINASSGNQHLETITREVGDTLGHPEQSLEQLALMIKHLNPQTISDQAILIVCKAVLTSQTPRRHNCLFIQYFLLPKFLLLNQQKTQAQQLKKASRQLYQSVQHACIIDPDALAETLLIPLICSQPLSSSQFEVVNRVISTCLPQDAVAKFIKKLVSEQPMSDMFEVMETQTQNNLLISNWNDFVSTLLKNIFVQYKDKILKDKEDESMQFIANLILRLVAVAPQFPTSSKFGALCTTIISQYGKLLIPHIDLMRSIVNMNQTFMKGAMNTALDNLANSSQV